MGLLFLRSSLEAVPPGIVSMAAESVTEGDVNMTFTVELSAPQDRDVRFDYTTGNLTATAGQDYTAVYGTKTIPEGETSTTIDVPILEDASDEPNESFALRLFNIHFV